MISGDVGGGTQVYVQMSAFACGSQRLALGVSPQELSTLFLEAVRKILAEIYQLGLGGWPVSPSSHPCLPNSGIINTQHHV